MKQFLPQATVATIGLALGVIGACQEPPKEPAPVIRPVRFIAIEPGGGDSSRALAGTAKSSQESNLSFRVSGRVEEVTAKVGQKVKAGTMLARLDPDKHNGAPLLGLRGVVVKSHGRSGPRATTHAILEAGREVEKNVPARIAEAVHRHHAEDN